MKSGKSQSLNKVPYKTRGNEMKKKNKEMIINEGIEEWEDDKEEEYFENSQDNDWPESKD